MSRPRLATRLLQAQALVVGVGAVTLVVAAGLIAPQLFHGHLVDAGIADEEMQHHAEAAFASSFAISVVLAAVAALVTAGAISWFVVRRVSRPVEELSRSAEAVAAGDFQVVVPEANFSSELHELSASFSGMAVRLGEIDSARSRLLADLAHELRTPLATLEACIDALDDGLLEPTSSSWEIMRAQVHRLGRLAGDVREAAAAEEHALGLRFERIDARAVVADAAAAASPRFLARDVELRTDVGVNALWIRADRLRLEQVLANLLDNALRHTDKSGHVSVSARGEGKDITITVTDDGQGIEADQLTLIFDRFHRADPSRTSSHRGGSGLGLTIARAIVNDHGGVLEAASDGLGRGATFRVRVPQWPGDSSS